MPLTAWKHTYRKKYFLRLMGLRDSIEPTLLFLRAWVGTLFFTLDFEGKIH